MWGEYPDELIEDYLEAYGLLVEDLEVMYGAYREDNQNCKSYESKSKYSIHPIMKKGSRWGDLMMILGYVFLFLHKMFGVAPIKNPIKHNFADIFCGLPIDPYCLAVQIRNWNIV